MNIVLIGGGTGSFTLLQELKRLSPNIAALVNMSDDGGSTGVLRDELGVLPPGDVRQCLVALSEAHEELRDLFSFRFASGTLEGHSFGNIFLSAVEKMSGDFNDAVRIAGDILRITGRVLPITLDDHKLVLTQPGGDTVFGQFRVANTKLARQPALSLEPMAALNPAAKQAFVEADLIVIAPGNLYCSLVPALLVSNLANAVRESPAKVAYVCNLVNKADQTPDFMVHHYADEVERFLGPDSLNFVLYNTDIPEDELLKKYATQGEYPVLYDVATMESASYEAIPGSFLSRAKQARNVSDSRIYRSLIRHDGRAIARALQKLLPSG